MFKKKILPILLSLALLINLFPAFALAAEGTGTADDPYLISTAAELKAFRDEVNAGNTSICAVLVDNIDLGGSADDPWTPIGNGTGRKFTGSFDGGGFEISGLYINTTDSDQGLFGYIGSGGEVANLGVSGSVSGITYFDKYGEPAGSTMVGGIAGENYGTITNCYNTGTVSGTKWVGGIAGYNYGTITNCCNTGAVSSYSQAGGIAGVNYGGTVTNCCNTGAVTGIPYLDEYGNIQGGNQIGGIVGLGRGSTVTNCYNTGTISGEGGVGGNIGETERDVQIFESSNGIKIEINGSDNTSENCYNTGTVSGDRNIGGNIGANNGTVTNCSNTGTVSGNSQAVGGNIGWSFGGPVTNCYNTGAVSSYYQAGGNVGYNYYGTITDCYNTGEITDSGYGCVGGNVGYSYSGSVANCYSTGAVSGSSNVGGNVGYNESSYGYVASVTNCYYLDTAVSGGGINGADVEGSAEPLTAAEFAVTSNFNNWDFDTVWGMDALLGRPVLQQMPESVFTEGNGTEEHPYLIPDLETLELFRDYINAGSGSGEYFELTANIDLSSKYGADINGAEASWTPIGDYAGSGTTFTGHFDGGGFEISGLYINTTANYQGLFGYIGTDGTVANLGVSGSVTVSGEDSRNAGGIAGYNYGGTITNCYNTAVVSGYYYASGIAGYNGNGTITNCYNTGAVSGSQYVGGITGWNRDTITNCYNTGNVTVSRNFIGGIAGYNSANTTITNCYNTGDVTGSGNYVGGIVGYNYGNTTITNCYYLDTAVSGGIKGADVEGSAEPLTAAEFAVTSNFNNWDFDTVWGMSALLGRPVLQQIYTNVSEILLDSEKPTSFIIFSGEALTVDLKSYILNGEAVGDVSFRVDGELPDGLSLSDDSIISGDCTAAAGDYSIVIIMEAKNGVVQTLTLTLTVNAPSFLVTIPEQIEADGSKVEISAQDLSMAQSSRLSLCISESTVFELTNGDGDTLSYTVTTADGSEVLAGAEILSVPAAENSGSCELVFTADDPKYAGAYKGTVVFNISVVKASG